MPTLDQTRPGPSKQDEHKESSLHNLMSLSLSGHRDTLTSMPKLNGSETSFHITNRNLSLFQKISPHTSQNSQERLHPCPCSHSALC